MIIPRNSYLVLSYGGKEYHEEQPLEDATKVLIDDELTAYRCAVAIIADCFKEKEIDKEDGFEEAAYELEHVDVDSVDSMRQLIHTFNSCCREYGHNVDVVKLDYKKETA